jgi:hypothetical protein
VCWFRSWSADRLLVCNATLTLVRNVSMIRPLLIIVDDLHWLDRATAPVLGFLARRLAGTALGFLAASHADAAGSFVHTGLAELELRPLSNKQIGNRLFLSHRTVSARLYRVFPKLEITSRAALRDALPHQGATPWT